MKHYFTQLWVLAMVVIIAASCEKTPIDDVVDEPSRDAVAELYVNDLSIYTRVSIEDNETTGVVPTWTEGDILTLYNSNGTILDNFKCTSVSQGKFVPENLSTLLDDDANYTAIYPASHQATLDGAKSAINPSEQDGDKIDNLNSSLYMLSDFTYSPSSKITFESQMAVMTFKFICENKPSKLVFMNGDEEYTVNYSDIEPVGGVYTSYIMINPCEAGERNLVFSLYEEGAGEPFEVRETVIDAAFEVGKCYTTNLSDVDISGEYVLADFSADNCPADADTWIILDKSATNSDFEGLREALKSLHASGRHISLWFPNLTIVPSSALYIIDNKSAMDALVSVTADVATSVEWGVFKGCRSLASVSLPEIEVIDWSWITGCDKLLEIEIKDVTYTAENGVFYNEDKSKICHYSGGEGVTEFVAPDSVTEIGEWAFWSCNTLTSISCPGVTKINGYVFYGCRSLTSISFPAATMIGGSAFLSCVALTSISLPAATTIYDDAFRYCSSLTTLSLPKIEVFDWSWVTRCDKISEIEIKDVTYTAENGVFYNEDKSILYKYIGEEGVTDFTAPSSVKEIGESAFTSCAALTSVSLPAVTYIGSSAFSWCYRLTSISCPAVTTIDDHAFSDCSYLTSLSLPEATTIGSRAFSDCNALTSISLPEATSVGSYAFNECTSLTSLSLPVATSVGSLAFDECTALTTLSLPKIEVLDWSWISGCSKISEIEIKDVTYTAENGIFFNDDKSIIYRYIGVDGVTDFTAPSSVTEVGEDAFSSCAALTSVSLPEVTTIGEYAISICGALTSISLPKVTTLGNEAFYGCYVLTSLEIAAESKLISIGNSLFRYVETENIDLTIGSENENVDVDAKTWSGYTFKSITVI